MKNVLPSDIYHSESYYAAERRARVERSRMFYNLIRSVFSPAGPEKISFTE